MSGSGTIKAATYGDENTAADVTRAIVSLFQQGKNYIELKASPSILNMDGAGTQAELTTRDQENIRAEAEESCGNAADQECMNNQVQVLTNARLEEKAREQALPTIRGERLTVTVVEAGKTKTLVIPRDEIFRYGVRAPGDVPTEEYLAPLLNVLSVDLLWKATGNAVYYFIWAFGVALTWIALSQSYQLPTGQMIRPGDYWWLKYVGTVIAILSGGWGGFVIIVIVYFVLGLKHYIGQRSLLATTQ
jgi:hypothetical protein